MKTHLTVLPVLLLALLFGGCSEDNPLSSSITVRIEPDSAITMFTGDTVVLRAIVSGVTDTSVTWSIDSSDAPTGRLLPDGRFIAPDTVFGASAQVIIRATSTAVPEVWDEVTVTLRNRADTVDIPDTAGAAGNPVYPGSGSEYTYTTYQLDEQQKKIPGSGITEEYNVSRTGVEYDSEHRNVTIMLYNGKEIPVLYESNGDLSILWGEWLRLPFGSRSSGVLRKVDSTDAGSGGESTLITATFIGTGTVTIAGKKLLVHKILLNRSRSYDVQLIGRTQEKGRTEFWFAPAIGWFTHISDSNRQEIIGTAIFEEHNYVSELESYALK